MGAGLWLQVCGFKLQVDGYKFRLEIIKIFLLLDLFLKLFVANCSLLIDLENPK